MIHKLRFITDFKYILLTVLIIFSIPVLIADVRVYIDQPAYNISIGDEITVSVNVEGLVEPLRGFELQLSFNSSYFEVVDLTDFQEGNFLINNGPTQWYVIGEDGYYQVSCAILGVTTGSMSAGTLFTLTLKANHSTDSIGTDIVLSDIILRGLLNNSIAVDINDICNVTIEPQVYIIPLSQGWNLVSLPLLPADVDMEAVFADLITEGYLIKIQNDTAQSMEKNMSGTWVNNIGDFLMTEGYYVKVNTNCVLTVTGNPVPMPMALNLVSGWNIISYPFMNQQSAITVMQALIDDNKLIKVQNDDGLSLEKNISGNWVNNIGNFKTGEGYYVKLNAPATLQYTAGSKATGSRSGVMPDLKLDRIRRSQSIK